MPIRHRCRLAVVSCLAAASIVLGSASLHAQGQPATPVETLDAGLLQVMQQGRATPFATRVQTLTPVVQSSFDLETILRNSVGSTRFRAFSPEQQAELLDSFTQFTVASYVANFDAFSGERFEVLPPRQAGADTVVPTRILAGAAEAAKLDYVVRSTGAGYRISDVLLDGSISRVAVQRSDFRALVASGNPNPLIAMLRQKVANFSTGAKF